MRKKELKTRDKIIKNALRIFAQKGFFRTTVDDIAEATGVAKGTVYLYFSNKEDLYTASIDEHFNIALGMLSEVDQSPGTPGEKMNKIATDYVNYITDLRTTYLPFSFESMNLSSKTLKKIHSAIEPKLHEMVNTISRIIKDGIGHGEFRRVDPQLAAFYFLSTIRAIFFNHFYVTNDSIKTESVLELFFDGLNKRR
ncbi:MAG: TetR/AcrR family transcriptional regulator [candidate division WOR-3 bacterium]|nr:MAG: TetR/AcrR family transcriptional regulator [candidate division WOR-3 bacterium]